MEEEELLNIGGGFEEVVDSESSKCLSSFVDKGSIDSHRYYLARRTVLEMFRDRGYSVPSSEIDFSLQQFRATFSDSPDVDRLAFSATHSSDPSKRIMLVFCGPGIVKIATVRHIVSQIVNRDGLSGLVLVIHSNLTKQAEKALEVFSFKVETFWITDLLINISKHVLKPRHQILNDEEKKRLLEKYKIQDKQLPRLSMDDAIVRYYGLQKGQVLKFMYDGNITESYFTYRCVW
ncbi:hypothetical protein Tsubulata_023258 [Turnera subulata]|uniref:RNA polymerase subunit H/Rpb5 C-terminal domain-containing protein n=1 Tax=Turnera subulata TaxID=218843 RepID=A0A9Q0FAW4_9ROSI|nr:hypothetical protein Tsubulata_023258 [Turnera subulata]